MKKFQLSVPIEVKYLVSVEQAVITGYKLIWKYKKLLLIPLIWEALRLIMLWLGLNLGGFGQGAGQFYLPLALPKLWFSIDDVLPLPALGPSLVGAFYPTLHLTSEDKMLIFMKILLLSVPGALLKGGFLGWIKDIFAGIPLKWSGLAEHGKQYFHRFFMLELVVLLANLIGWFLINQTGAFAPFVQKFTYMVIHLLLMVTGAWIVFADYSLWGAMSESIRTFLTYGQKLIPFALAGILINGLIAVPLNWAMGNWVGLGVGILIYLVVGSGLSIGLMYLFSGLEYSQEWKTN